MEIKAKSNSVEALGPENANDVDVLIVGAGFAGLYNLYNLRKLGFNVLVVDAAGSVGGTWYWARYPGVRVDIESVEYSYSFSEELQQEWSWSERYPAPPELLKYFSHVADRFDLRKNICLNTRVNSAVFDEAENKWTIETDTGRKIRATYCVMATGFLSAPNMPEFPGLDQFKGETFHTAYWPQEDVDFSKKRVAVIGTGSSGVQCISEVGKNVGQMTVFQRTPSFCVPLRNCPMPPEYEKSVKENYAEWRRLEREEAFGGFMACNFEPAERIRTSALDATPEERLALYEDRYKSGGLAMYFVYPDVFRDKAANETLTKFLQDKIRERVNDPELAELLVPKDYPALLRRLCADTNYYETYNQDNVSLVDVRGGEIEFTETGISLKGEEYEFDSVIFATGYDAMTGALTRIDIRGTDGRQLKEHWEDGARTALGMMSVGFPNMFFINGPGSPCPFYQPVLLGEDQGGWVGEWLTTMRDKELSRIEPTEELQDEWINHCTEVLNNSLFPLANSWYVGRNIPGKPAVGLAYVGEPSEYRRRCAEVLPSGFEGFKLSVLQS